MCFLTLAGQRKHSLLGFMVPSIITQLNMNLENPGFNFLRHQKRRRTLEFHVGKAEQPWLPWVLHVIWLSTLWVEAMHDALELQICLFCVKSYDKPVELLPVHAVFCCPPRKSFQFFVQFKCENAIQYWQNCHHCSLHVDLFGCHQCCPGYGTLTGLDWTRLDSM